MKWILTLFLYISCLSLYALDQDSTRLVSLITYLNKGETLNYSAVKTRIDSTGNKETKNIKNTFDIKLTVVDSTDSSYVFDFYKSSNVTDNPQIASLPIAQQQKIQALSQLTIKYETNEVGAFKRIINEEQILDKIKDSFNDVKSLVTSSSENEKAVEIFDQLLASTDPKTLLSLYAQDILALHYALGLEFNIQDTTEFEEEIIAPFLNIPIETYGIFYCDEYQADKNYISFIEEKVIADNFMEKVGEFLKKFENKNNPIPIDEFKNMDMNIYINNNYQYNSLYGVPVYIDMYKVISVTDKKEDQKRIEQYIISITE